MQLIALLAAFDLKYQAGLQVPVHTRLSSFPIVSRFSIVIAAVRFLLFSAANPFPPLPTDILPTTEFPEISNSPERERDPHPEHAHGYEQLNHKPRARYRHPSKGLGCGRQNDTLPSSVSQLVATPLFYRGLGGAGG